MGLDMLFYSKNKLAEEQKQEVEFLNNLISKMTPAVRDIEIKVVKNVILKLLTVDCIRDIALEEPRLKRAVYCNIFEELANGNKEEVSEILWDSYTCLNEWQISRLLNVFEEAQIKLTHMESYQTLLVCLNDLQQRRAQLEDIQQWKQCRKDNELFKEILKMKNIDPETLTCYYSCELTRDDIVNLISTLLHRRGEFLLLYNNIDFDTKTLTYSANW